ncbi:Anthranilate 3-monooxygenase oxygenase component [Pseudovibrio axinellae]|uniref:Anthranilate 3-monooxygenase oxygenase component n=1 Tax=Pseudovibrio axinellae TaxID=989403 RepID=A0A165U0L1_9HYPH|nr:4-hydroxyphenylacetate 3-hydroxylase N-terminal domain-containing protein [Pseudovibrio axinellae]KZL09095.1 Anthranilate 3-monooxygenase oxygenase component [Pseudovibrio axinellae]SER75170.1 4-hydroxyphenylacetate 3-monooxygenase [Pseudovibrio axinellae]
MIDLLEKTTVAGFTSREAKNKLERSTAQGLWTGERLIESLRDGRKVYHEGELVDVTKHPNFTAPLSHLASLQDWQHKDGVREAVSFETESGVRASMSYALPHTHEELEQKVAASHEWMAATHGLMPRLPDFMSNVMVGLWDFRERLARVNPDFAESVEAYYAYCRDNDIILTHAIGDPQMDRSVRITENPDMALRVVERSSDGIVVRGAKQLATLAPYCHDALVYLSPTYARRELPDYVCWFSVPMNAEGLSMLARPSMAGRRAGSPHELADRFEEHDAMIFFDDVFIPKERVFLLDDAQTALDGFWHLNRWSLYVGQIRFYHRLRFMLGVARLAARAIGVSEFREIKSDLGELAQYCELSRLGLKATLAESDPTGYGLIAPGSTLALDTYAAQISGRLTEILTKISGSGSVMQACAVDFADEGLAALIERYMHGHKTSAKQKAAIFHLVRNLVADSFGGRQHIYELWNRGDPVRNRMTLADALPDLDQLEQNILEEFSFAEPKAQ